MSNNNCCVFGCSNTYKSTRQMVPVVQFHSFPSRSWELDVREKWITFANRITIDGQPWRPTANSKICSQHFVGGKKSPNPLNPSYLPTIYTHIFGESATRPKRKMKQLTPWHERLNAMTEEKREALLKQQRERIRYRRNQVARVQHVQRHPKVPNEEPTRWQNRLHRVTLEEREEFLRQHRERGRQQRHTDDAPEERKQRQAEVAKLRRETNAREAYSQLTPEQLSRLYQSRREQRQKEPQREHTTDQGTPRGMRQARREAARAEQDKEGDSSSAEARRKEVAGLRFDEAASQENKSYLDQVTKRPVSYGASICMKNFSSWKLILPHPAIKKTETTPDQVENLGGRSADHGKGTSRFKELLAKFELGNRYLQWHVISNTGEKPFKCDYGTCERSFARSSDLGRHKRVHEKFAAYEKQLNILKQNFSPEQPIRCHASKKRSTSTASGNGKRSAEGYQIVGLAATYSEDLSSNSNSGKVDNTGFEGIPRQLLCETQIKTEPDEYDEEVESDTAMDTKLLGDMYNFLDPGRNHSQTAVKNWMENVTVKIEPSGCYSEVAETSIGVEAEDRDDGDGEETNPEIDRKPQIKVEPEEHKACDWLVVLPIGGRCLDQSDIRQQ